MGWLGLGGGLENVAGVCLPENMNTSGNQETMWEEGPRVGLGVGVPSVLAEGPVVSVRGRVCEGNTTVSLGSRGRGFPQGREDVLGCDGGAGPHGIGIQGNHGTETGASRERRVNIS